MGDGASCSGVLWYKEEEEYCVMCNSIEIMNGGSIVPCQI